MFMSKCVYTHTYVYTYVHMDIYSIYVVYVWEIALIAKINAKFSKRNI